MNDVDAETRGLAILGMSLGHAALTMLNAKGIISNDEIDSMLETILVGAETLLPPDDPGAQMARKLAEGLAHTIRQNRGKPTKETH